jgi:hypothetical protein
MAAEDAGSIVSQLRLELTQMEKDAFEAQKKMDDLAKKLKEKGESTGKGFAAGMKKGFDSTQSYAAKMGSSLAKSLTPALLGIQAGIKVVSSLASGFKNAMMANEKFSKAISDFKANLGASFASAVKPVSDFFGNLIQKAADSVKAAKALREELARLRGEVTSTVERTLSSEISSLEAAVEAQKKKVNSLEKSLGIGVSAEAVKKAREELQRLEADLEAAKQKAGGATVLGLSEWEKIKTSYEQAKKGIQEWIKLNDLSGDNVAKARQKELDALQAYIAGIEKLAETEKVAGTAIGAAYADAKKKEADLQNFLGGSLIQFNKLKKEWEDASKVAESTGKIGEKEGWEAEKSALESYIAGLIRLGDVQDAVLKSQIEAAKTASVDRLKQLNKLIETAGKKAEKEITFDERRIELMKQYEHGIKEAEAQRETNTHRGMSAAKAEKEEQEQIEQVSAQIYKNMYLLRLEQEATTDEAEAWVQSIEKVQSTLGVMELPETKKSKNGLANLLGLDDEGFEKMTAVSAGAISLFDGLADAALEISRRHAEEQIALIEEALNEMLEQIEQAREAELEQKGFIEAQSEEEFDRQIERARQSNDEILQYHLERRKEEMEINKKYDAQAKAEEEKAARAKADIEYRVAIQEHAMQIIQATNAGIMAVVQASNNWWPIPAVPLMAMAGALTAAQIGMLLANPPQYPHFADGGIVPGRKADGDVQHIMATAGEVILDEAKQENIANKLENGRFTQLTVILQVDSKEMARSMADVYGSGTVLIPARGIGR